MPKGEGAEVSIIIPTYQEGRYLEVILSDLARMNPPVEIVVVDGGSKDETVNTARRFTEKVYKLNQRGIARAKNYGAKMSNGDILIFMDADVTAPPEFVEKIYETFNDSTVVGATCKIMPTSPRLTELIFFIFYNWLLRLCSRFKPHARGEFIAIKRKAFSTINGFDEDLPCLEDHRLALRASKLGRFVFIRDLTVYETLRRIRKTGLLNVVGTWLIDYIFLLLRGRPLSKVWPSVR